MSVSVNPRLSDTSLRKKIPIEKRSRCDSDSWRPVETTNHTRTPPDCGNEYEHLTASYASAEPWWSIFLLQIYRLLLLQHDWWLMITWLLVVSLHTHWLLRDFYDLLSHTNASVPPMWKIIYLKYFLFIFHMLSVSTVLSLVWLLSLMLSDIFLFFPFWGFSST